uniref:Reverse transcriptase domain-containing protein n=1 Tax=Leptobrachium leishanense TaxID=445787 RepID=A0A8C5P7K0_9ANUR
MRDLEKMPSRERHYNLTKEENKALKNLQNDSNIVIKPADKGGGTVILSKEAYDTEVLRILSDTSTYEPLKGDPINGIRSKLNALLLEGKENEILNEKEYDYLKMEYIKTPHIYILPKIHKSLTHPPGRPIVAGINSITSRLSEYVDILLQPIVQEVPSYLKDTISMLNLLQGLQYQTGDIMVTCDVNALYSSIPHLKGLSVVGEVLSQTHKIPVDQISYILKSMEFILNNNYFKFENDFFIQRKGTAMGTKFAPSYANLYMAGWESQFVYGSHSWAQHKILSYRRYIDDVFFVWRGAEEDLISFLNGLDNLEWGIKLDRKWSVDK